MADTVKILEVHLGPETAAEFAAIAASRGHDDPAELLRQHAYQLVSDARMDALLADAPVVITGERADEQGSTAMQRWATRNQRALLVVGATKHHAGKEFRP